jgi:hypothetical protein
MASERPIHQSIFPDSCGRINASSRQLWHLIAALISLQIQRYLVDVFRMLRLSGPLRQIKSSVDRTEHRILDILPSLMSVQPDQQTSFSNNNNGRGCNSTASADDRFKQRHPGEDPVNVVLGQLAQWNGLQSQETINPYNPPINVPAVVSPLPIAKPPSSLKMVSIAPPATTRRSEISFSDSIYSLASHRQADDVQSSSAKSSWAGSATMYTELISTGPHSNSTSGHSSVGLVAPQKIKVSNNVQINIADLSTDPTYPKPSADLLS